MTSYLFAAFALLLLSFGLLTKSNLVRAICSFALFALLLCCVTFSLQAAARRTIEIAMSSSGNSQNFADGTAALIHHITPERSLISLYGLALFAMAVMPRRK
ncbi:hypothetical protein [Hydrocarboniphaga sp.]|uniref:hypothetical protein n=1 Tax=Hydrocarboniphaga sp. TaxID=2033016 RepID=UPI002629115F|nr:hypothetical protein [Hydrocarboniphaga sp.]